MTFLKITSYGGDKAILFGSTNMSTPNSVSISATDVLANYKSEKYVPEGMFIADVAGTIRTLPRTKTKLATATNSRLVSLKAPCFNFKVGDVLKVIGGYAEILISGTVATGNVITVRTNNASYSVTIGGTQTAAAAAALVAGLTIPGVTLAQVGSTGKVALFSIDSYKLDVSATGEIGISVATTEAGYFGDMVTPLGTIESIAAPNANDERVVTLVANATAVVPVGVSVGVDTNKVLGVFPNSLDLTETPVLHIAPYLMADGVYENNLPYVDGSIKRALPRLNIQKKFYQA